MKTSGGGEKQDGGGEGAHGVTRPTLQRPKYFTNPEPRTWACECGQMNLLADRTCFSCAGDKDECWEAEDRKGQR